MTKTTVRALREELLAAAERYAVASDGGEGDPLADGAKLRLAAKHWTAAKRALEAVTCPPPARLAIARPTRTA